MFLHGKNLSDSIREVLSGKQPRMAVSFLQPRIAANLFSGELPHDLKIVCDIEIGGTNPDALRELGAPTNENLRHIDCVQLHSKVYLSEIGAVVCSANASDQALNRPETRIEAGVLVPNHALHFKDLENWFSDLLESSIRVDEDAIERAALSYAYSDRGSSKEKSNYAAKPQQLLEVLKRFTHAFDGTEFLLSEFENDPNLIDEAYEREDVLSEEITKESNFSEFTEWEIPDAEWPVYFVNIHRWRKDENSAYVYSMGKYIKKFVSYPLNEAKDVVFAQRLRIDCQPARFNGAPKLRKLNDADVRALNGIDAEAWGKKHSAQKLSDLIQKAE